MTSTNEDAPSKEKNDDILKSLRHLNSCITLTSVKDGDAGSKSTAESSDSESEEEPDLSIPSALRGLSFGGAKGTSISALLSKSKENKEPKPPTNYANLSALRGISIKGFNPKGSSSPSVEKNSLSKLPVIKGLTIQGVTNKEDNSTSEEEEEQEDEEEQEKNPINSFRGVSIGKVSNKTDNNSEDSSASNSPNRSASPEVPSALRNLLLKGNVSSSLADILRKSKEKKPEQKEKPSALSDWTQKGLSISFSKETNKEPLHSENDFQQSSGNDSDSRESHQPNETPENKELKSPVESNISYKPDIPLSSKGENSSFSSKGNSFTCPNCKEEYSLREELQNHLKQCKTFRKRRRGSDPVARKKTRHPGEDQVAKKRTAAKVPLALVRNRQKRSCLSCGIVNFKSFLAYEEHHAAHAHSKLVSVRLKKCKLNKKLAPESNQENNLLFNAIEEPIKGFSEKQGLKVKFKITQKGSRGRRRKTVEIINSQQDMSGSSEGEETPDRTDFEPQSESEQEHHQQQEQELQQDHQFLSPQPPDAIDKLPTAEGVDPNVAGPSGINNNFTDFTNFDNSDAAINDRPPSAYQPQFESFTGDWFNEYESGSRIAAAMTGSSEEGGQQGRENYIPPPATDGASAPTDDQGGLFSQAVLGGENQQPNSSENNQGSFEQLCLNDTFGANQNQSNQAPLDPNYQQQQYPPSQGPSDILSELDYLNNQQVPPHDPSNASPINQNFSPHSSNSGTPNSIGQPTPPPSDTSFRALATSPNAIPMNTNGGPTPPLHSSSTPPSSVSPLQHMSQMSQHDSPTAPRLTIANNLMPSSSNNVVSPQPYDQQWQNQSSPSFASTFGQNTQSPYGQSSPIQGNNGARTYASLPPSYRPSPPPRIRGRPPLVGMPSINRPSMIRGPGRPPAGMPNLMGGNRMSSMQRNYSRGGTMIGGQKRPLPSSMNQSPNKIGRKEDINVPSRQKDNECQIIAVANRNEGMPVIANVQGGSSNRTTGGTDSTIHLSDSITLSVRPNGGAKDATKTKEGGEAGVVANLLASRGITVTPAEKEREEQRRLPTASDLNLSSAISVHPPTARDRDGFAVPQPPSPSKPNSGVNSQVERPPRPPTVDLTSDVSPTGGSRVQCSQCSRTFPNQALLADHAKIHQQQQQNRMPFKCHLCSAGFSSQKGQQNHYQQFHQLHLSAGDLAIPVVDFRNPVNVQRMARLGITSFLPLSNLQNRGAGGVVGVPILTLDNLRSGQMNMQQWGITDVLTLGPPKTLNTPRLRGGPAAPIRPPRPS